MPNSRLTIACKHGGASIERWWNLLLYRVASPQFLVSGLLLITLVYLVLGPLSDLAWRTLTWGESDLRLSRDAVPGEFTFAHWKTSLFGPEANGILLEPLLNTLITGVIAALVALLLGGMLAWFVTRTDIPGRGWLRPVLTLPYVIPAFALALAWETLFRSPAIGGEPGFFQVIFNAAPPAWISYGPVPIIITMAIHYSPFAFLLVSGALETVDVQLIESAELLGASRWTILRKITFPLVTPALMAAFVLTFGKTLGTFALPFLLGAPIQYYTLSTMLFTNLRLGLDARGYILALVLILITALVVYVSARVLGGNLRRFETIGGKGFKSHATGLGSWRWPATGLVASIALITGILPIVLLGYQTLMLVDGRYGLDNLTLHYWFGGSNPDIAFGEPGVIHNPVILGAAWNSLRLAFLSSAICAILGLVIGYIMVRNRRSWIAKLLDQISFMPFLIPAIAFGSMYLSLFAVRRGPIPALYGTFTLLVLISVINRLPYSTRTGSSAVTQIGQELEEAAEIQGASWFWRLWRIVLPLATSGVVAGMMVSFVGMMRELSLIILLITPATRVLMTVGFRYVEEDQTQLANTLVLLVTLITIVGELTVWWAGKGQLARLQDNT
ncbi:MAG: ABC transporter permease [Candidatus Binatia bacterium]